MTHKQKTQPSMFEVGQEVTYRSGGRYSTDQTVTIARVGRKYAYAKVGHAELAFDRVTGEMVGSTYGQFGDRARIVTPEILAAEERYRAAQQRVKHLRENYGAALERLSVEQLERIGDILEEEQ